MKYNNIKRGFGVLGILIILGLVVAGGGGGYYYSKVVKTQDAPAEITSEEGSIEIPENVEEETLTEVPEVAPAVKAKSKTIGLDAAGDCSLLTPADVSAVCSVANVDLEAVDLDVEDYEVCKSRFIKAEAKYADRIYQSVTMTYTNDPSDDDAATVFKKWPTTGEKISDHAIFVPVVGGRSIIFGSEYRITIISTMGNAVTRICSEEQLKELGKLVSDRIFAN